MTEYELVDLLNGKPLVSYYVLATASPLLRWSE